MTKVYDGGSMTRAAVRGSRHGGDRAGRPDWPGWYRPCRPIRACAFAALTMVSNSGAFGPVHRCPVWTLSMKLSSFGTRPGGQSR